MITAAGVETLLQLVRRLVTLDGAIPNLIDQGSDGNFLRNNSARCTSNLGTGFKITPAGIKTILHSFDTTEGQPQAPLVQGGDGNFFTAQLATAARSAEGPCSRSVRRCRERFS